MFLAWDVGLKGSDAVIILANLARDAIESVLRSDTADIARRGKLGVLQAR
jgi:hypothetical protein